MRLLRAACVADTLTYQEYRSGVSAPAFSRQREGGQVGGIAKST
jgi:hypothetical protein